jgi:GNAT superfamily N-acetyltransferase
LVTLKDITVNDLTDLLHIRSHKSTRDMLEDNSIFHLSECEDWFNKTKPQWKMISYNDNQNIGYIRIKDDTVGIDIHPDFRRQGIARQAYEQILPTKDKWRLWVFEDNHAKQLYLELGFIATGESKLVRDKQYIEMIKQ